MAEAEQSRIIIKYGIRGDDEWAMGKLAGLAGWRAGRDQNRAMAVERARRGEVSFV